MVFVFIFNIMKILMVCLGNICRSPLAEGIMKSICEENNLNWEIESASTSDYHIGEHPDPRSIKKAKDYNIDISQQKGKQFDETHDFEYYDLIYVMDKSNYENICKLTSNKKYLEKVKLILSENQNEKTIEVPDPYWSKDDGFEHVYQLLNNACLEIIKKY